MDNPFNPVDWQRIKQQKSMLIRMCVEDGVGVEDVILLIERAQNFAVETFGSDPRDVMEITHDPFLFPSKEFFPGD